VYSGYASNGAGAGTLQLKPGIVPADLRFRQVSSPVSGHRGLEISIAGSSDTISFSGFLDTDDPAAPHNGLQQIRFDDGTIWNLAQIIAALKGPAKSLAANMDASLTVPTATSVRTVPAKLMIDNRIVINNHLKRARGGKVSFTHLIAWAIVQTLKEFPSQNVHYHEVDGKAPVGAPAPHAPGHPHNTPQPCLTVAGRPRKPSQPGVRAASGGLRDRRPTATGTRPRWRLPACESQTR